MKVTASVSADDVRRRYYESAGYSMWITEMQLDPLQLIVCDDSTGKFFRVPVTLSGSEFEFGDPVEVAIQYTDVKGKAAASAIVWASRDESLGGMPGGAPTPPAPPTNAPVTPAEAARRIHNAPVAAATGPTKEGPEMDPAKMREALGLAADASDDEVKAALASAGLAGAPPAPPTPEPEPDAAETLPPVVPVPAAASGAVVLDQAMYATLRQQAQRGDEAFRKLRENECESVLDGAVKAGKIPPGRREHYKTLWAADPEGTKQLIDGLAANVIPVMASGYPGVGDETEQDLIYAAMYPDSKVGGGRG